MTSIKTYLLLLFLVALFGSQAFSQSNFEKEISVQEHKFSKADSVLIETYLTERDYIEKHGIEAVNVCMTGSVGGVVTDEIYNDTPRDNNTKNRHLDDGALGVLIDVAIHTLLFMTLFWQ